MKGYHVLVVVGLALLIWGFVDCPAWIVRMWIGWKMVKFSSDWRDEELKKPLAKSGEGE